MADKTGADVVPIGKRGGRKAAAAPATPPAAPGHNGPSEDAIRVFVHGMLKLNEEMAAVKAKRSAYRKQGKVIGIELGIIDRRIKMLEWTPQEVKEYHETEVRYAEAMGQPVGTQLDMFGSADTATTVKEGLRWKGQGRIDGLAGRGEATEPPEGCPPEHHQGYAAGWAEGQNETQQAFLRSQHAKGPLS